jgi:hypothetical protein
MSYELAVENDDCPAHEIPEQHRFAFVLPKHTDISRETMKMMIENTYYDELHHRVIHLPAYLCEVESVK